MGIRSILLNFHFSIHICLGENRAQVTELVEYYNYLFIIKMLICKYHIKLFERTSVCFDSSISRAHKIIIKK